MCLPRSGNSHYPRERIVSLVVGTGLLAHMQIARDKLLVRFILLSSSSISPTGRRSSFRQASALALLNFLLPAKIVQIRDNFKFYTGLETVENSNYDNKREMRNRLRMFLRKYIKKYWRREKRVLGEIRGRGGR